MDAAGLNLTREDLDMVVALSVVELAGCSLNESPGKNWVENAGGLPTYICEIARAIKRSGKTTSQAISIAVSRVKKWAAGGDDVDADTRAKAAAAVAQWEKLKAKNRAKSTAKDVKASNMSALEMFAGRENRAALDRVVAFAGAAPPFVKKDGGDGKTAAPSGGGLNSPAAIRAAWAKAKTPEEKARIRAAAKKFKIELSG